MIENVTLDQLRVLIAVAETGSFSAAGRQLGRVQSAVSQSMQGLEAALGLAVFDRSGRTPRMTEAGLAILPDARRLVGDMRRLKARVADMAGGIEPELGLAVDPLFPTSLLILSLEAMSARFEGLPVTVFTDGLGAPLHRLQEGEVRLAIGSALPGTITDPVDTAFLARVRLVPVAAATHRLARMPVPLTRETLEEEVQLVLTDRSPLTRDVTGGIVSRRIWRFADLSTRLEFLLAGQGWCNMPRHMVEGHLAAGRLVELQTLPVSRPEISLNVMTLPSRPLGPAGRWLVADLRARLARCPTHFGSVDSGLTAQPETAEA